MTASGSINALLRLFQGSIKAGAVARTSNAASRSGEIEP